MLIRHSRGYLPHIDFPQGTYFLTFRLHDSLPVRLLQQWQNELQSSVRSAANNKASVYAFHKEYFHKIQNYLDTSTGSCWLREPTIARIVLNALRYFDGQRYTLHAWTIMPNHVHVLFMVSTGFNLSAITHTWKSFTAKQANQVLGRTGPFWQRESYDRLIKSQRQMEFVVRYILNNPVKAGLCKEFFQWPWTGCSAEIQDLAKRFF